MYAILFSATLIQNSKADGFCKQKSARELKKKNFDGPEEIYVQISPFPFSIWLHSSFLKVLLLPTLVKTALTFALCTCVNPEPHLNYIATPWKPHSHRCFSRSQRLNIQREGGKTSPANKDKTMQLSQRALPESAICIINNMKTFKSDQYSAAKNFRYCLHDVLMPGCPNFFEPWRF